MAIQKDKFGQSVDPTSIFGYKTKPDQEKIEEFKEQNAKNYEKQVFSKREDSVANAVKAAKEERLAKVEEFRESEREKGRMIANHGEDYTELQD